MTNKPYIPEIPKDPCDHLSRIQGLYRHPFSRPVKIMGEYQSDAGEWVVEVFNVGREETEDEEKVELLRLEFCPFCGLSLRKVREVSDSELLDSIEETAERFAKEAEDVPTKSKK